jgi:hypothetical protein
MNCQDVSGCPPSGRVPRDLTWPTLDDLGLAIEAPLEQETNVVLYSGDEVIDRNHRVYK